MHHACIFETTVTLPARPPTVQVSRLRIASCDRSDRADSCSVFGSRLPVPNSPSNA